VILISEKAGQRGLVFSFGLTFRRAAAQRRRHRVLKEEEQLRFWIFLARDALRAARFWILDWQKGAGSTECAASLNPKSKIQNREACKLLLVPSGTVDGGRKHWLDIVARCAVFAAGKE
jgi:hypothetical protein